MANQNMESLLQLIENETNFLISRAEAEDQSFDLENPKNFLEYELSRHHKINRLLGLMLQKINSYEAEKKKFRLQKHQFREQFTMITEQIQALTEAVNICSECCGNLRTETFNKLFQAYDEINLLKGKEKHSSERIEKTNPLDSSHNKSENFLNKNQKKPSKNVRKRLFYNNNYSKNGFSNTQ